MGSSLVLVPLGKVDLLLDYENYPAHYCPFVSYRHDVSECDHEYMSLTSYLLVVFCCVDT